MSQFLPTKKIQKNMSADELFEIRKKIASTEAKLKVAEEANDEVSIARLETLLTERLKKENFLLTSSASAGARSL